MPRRRVRRSTRTQKFLIDTPEGPVEADDDVIQLVLEKLQAGNTPEAVVESLRQHDFTAEQGRQLVDQLLDYRAGRATAGGRPSAELPKETRDLFAAAARRYRRVRGLVPLAAMLAALLGAAAGVVAFPHELSAVAQLALFGSLGTLSVGYLLFLPRLQCPGCSRRIEGRLGVHCPTCGSKQLIPGGLLRWTSCESCGTVLSHGKGGRHYPVRVCTHCGLSLSDQDI